MGCSVFWEVLIEYVLPGGQMAVLPQASPGRLGRASPHLLITAIAQVSSKDDVEVNCRM